MCKGITPKGDFEVKEDGSKRSLLSFALPPKEWDIMQTSLNRAVKRPSSEPVIQTLDADSKAKFFKAVSRDFAK